MCIVFLWLVILTCSASDKEQPEHPVPRPLSGVHCRRHSRLSPEPAYTAVQHSQTFWTAHRHLQAGVETELHWGGQGLEQFLGSPESAEEVSQPNERTNNWSNE